MLYVFSDESGNLFAQNQPYYIRSFIFICGNDYLKLCGEFKKMKEKHKITKEIKFNDFKNNIERYDAIFNINFKAYIVFTNKYKDFDNRQYGYKLKETILNKFDQSYAEENFIKKWKEDEKDKIKTKLRAKIGDAFKYFYWLNFFEKYYYMNVKQILSDIYKTEDYSFEIDKPTFSNNDYIDLLQEIGINKINIIKKSEDSVGIQLADIVAGSLRDVLLNKTTEHTHYTQYVYKKLLNNEETEYLCSPKANPCKVHFSDTEREEIDTYNKILKTNFLYLKTN